MAVLVLGEGVVENDLEAAGREIADVLEHHPVGFACDETFAQTGTAVIDPKGMAGETTEGERDVVEHDVVDLAGNIAAYEATVLTDAFDIAEGDVADLAATALGGSFGKTPTSILVVADGTGIGGDIDGLGLAPPNIGEEAAFELHVLESDVGDGALVAVLYAQGSIAGTDDALVEDDVGDAVHVLTSYLDGAGATRHDAVADADVLCLGAAHYEGRGMGSKR